MGEALQTYTFRTAVLSSHTLETTSFVNNAIVTQQFHGLLIQCCCLLSACDDCGAWVWGPEVYG